MTLDEIHASLGIPADYGKSPYRPRFEDTRTLVDIGCDINCRPQKLAPRAATRWRLMSRAARHDGIELGVVSAFRSIAYQTALYRNQLDGGRELADLLGHVAAPGYSQHHTGMALDVTAADSEALEENFEETDAFAWLTANASRYGFYLPYARDNEFGFVYEPWHWAIRCLELTRKEPVDD